VHGSLQPVVEGKVIGNSKKDLVARYANAWDSTKSPLIPKSSMFNNSTFIFF
jgi:hypothetical protein